MKFSEMKYERADVLSVCKEYEELTGRLNRAKTAEEVAEVIAKHEKLSSAFETMASLAYVRHSINTLDPYYDKENEYYDENYPVLQEKTNAFMRALLESPFRPEIEKRMGGLVFKNLEMELKTFSPEVISDLQTENKLVSDYQKLVASAEIEFDGKKLNISQLGVYKTDRDRETRKAAFGAEGDFYMSHAEELDRIFDDLVKVRTKIAKKLGFNSFTELAYCRRTRNCYDAKDVKVFRDSVKRDIVPVVCRIKEEQAKRIGVDKLYLYDDAFFYPEGNPRPLGTPDDILAAGKRMYEEMSDETAEFINFMYSNELLDVVAKKGKAVGGYCTSLPDYKAPFIFSNFNGTSGDVEVLTHEAGHAFADYTVRDFPFRETTQPTMEACETHSMSMEFLAWPWLGLYYGDEAERAKTAHLADSFVFIPYGCMVDEFQHIVYDDPTLTPAQRHEAWDELEKQYRPYLSREGMSFYGAGRGWQRQLHIYHYPFYYIDYCLAQTNALNVWQLSLRDYKDAWERYMRFVRQGGRMTFVGLCKEAGIPSPFEEGALRDIAIAAREYIG